LLALHDAGAVVLPASPGFYAGTETVQELVDFVAGKVLDSLGVDHTLFTRWRGQLGAARNAAFAPAATQAVDGAWTEQEFRS
jgi:4-hydroxy-3-polyprenylbenzoate decarboxylase